jgi:hypothetical protein
MRVTIPSKRFKTGIANGSRVLDGVDGRSHHVRRFREVSSAICHDIDPSANGDNLTEAKRQIIRSAAGLVCLRESLDVKAAKEGPDAVNVATYCLISNTLRRVLTTIGLERVQLDVTDEGLAEFDAEMRRLEQEDAALRTCEATP